MIKQTFVQGPVPEICGLPGQAYYLAPPLQTDILLNFFRPGTGLEKIWEHVSIAFAEILSRVETRLYKNHISDYSSSVLTIQSYWRICQVHKSSEWTSRDIAIRVVFPLPGGGKTDILNRKKERDFMHLKTLNYRVK
jgi:hypothetical protein